MLTRLSILCAILGTSLSSFGAGHDDAKKAGRGFVVHEWGTFTALAGSNGTQIVGLTHDEESLPKFVYHRDKLERGFDGIRIKMETPVIYFYSDVEREVNVKVGFPKGLMTQWYPQARGLTPAVDNQSKEAKNGAIDWGTVKVLAPSQGMDKVPATEKGDPWVFARETGANVIRVCGAGGMMDGKNSGQEHERFLFYRGLGSFTLPVKASIGADGKLNLENTGQQSLDGTMLLHVTKDKIFAKGVDGLTSKTRQEFDTRLPEVNTEQAMDLVAARLEKAGLYRDEARAMVNTWKKSYFQTEGFRVLYMVPPADTQEILPLTIEPKPDELVRVLVGRLDVLLPEQEERAKKTVREADTMEQARLDLGRFAEPIVRYVRETTHDEELRVKADRLLAATR